MKFLRESLPEWRLRVADFSLLIAMTKIAELFLWLDRVPRSGAENMAIDEWLLETAERPVLRIYEWSGAWGSLGYFGSLAEARRVFPGLSWVRRWSGGGIVDHRDDWTYTLVLPRGAMWAQEKGGESYRHIHSALARALAIGQLAEGTGATGGTACFKNPVAHDLVDQEGRKIAGAGQRRTAGRLLHQGSVSAKCGGQASVARAKKLAGELANCWELIPGDFDRGWVEEKVAARYGARAWTEKK